MYELDLGDGHGGELKISDGLRQDFNRYARVTAVNRNVITIDNVTDSEISNFDAGENVLIHVSATNGTSADLLGKYLVAKIELVDGNTLTLDKDVFDVDLNFYYVQIVTIPQFRKLTLHNSRIAPRPYDVFKFTGGIFAVQVLGEFELQHSEIDLSDAGIPTTKKNVYRPLTLQEYDGETDGSRRAGEENFITAQNLLLNSGDGAAFIQAHDVIFSDDSRIGNPDTHGRANCRGAADSPFKPSNTTNIGGSTILIAAENITISAENIAKYRTADKPAGKGLARCYIAAENLLPADENLYAFDILKDESRVQKLGVENFGGGDISLIKPQYKLNNRAQITGVDGNTLYFAGKTLGGYADIALNSLILIRNAAGEIALSRVLNYGEGAVVVEKFPNAPIEFFTVPEFDNLELENYTSENILAAVVKGTLTLRGDIKVQNALKLDCGNAQSWNKASAIFFAANKIIFEENSRISPAMIITNEVENFDANIFTDLPNFVYSGIV